MKSFQGIIFACIAGILLFAGASAPVAACDLCMMIYPDAPCVYHYDTSEYITVRPGDPYYNPLYDRGGKVLLRRNVYTIDYSIYQAPNIVGFYPSTDGQDGYFVATSEFNLVIDGFSRQQQYYPNIVLIFDNVKPLYCVPEIRIHGELLSGMTYAAGNLVVSTPILDGKYYSDVISVRFSQRGCYGIRIWAFSDENGNGILDEGECRSSYSRDTMVPVRETTWGSIKAMYR